MVPIGDHGSCVRKVVEVVIVRALVSKLAVEALDTRPDGDEASSGSDDRRPLDFDSTGGLVVAAARAFARGANIIDLDQLTALQNAYGGKVSAGDLNNTYRVFVS